MSMQPSPKPRWWRRFAVLAVTCVAAMTAGTAAWAVFNDQATMTSGTFTAHTVTSQAAPVCSNQGGVLGLLGFARLTWTHVDARYEYTYTIVQVNNGNVAASGVVTPAGAAGTAVTLDVSSSLVSVGLPGVNYDVTVRARLKAAPTWTAATATVTRVHSVNIILIGLSMSCGPL